MERENIILTFLGTGTSHGVPMIGCDCPTCRSDDPRDKRSNASLLVTVRGKNILIDCGRDFRQQALRQGLKEVDYVLVTHTHFDHIAGLDDLRVYSRRERGPIPVMGHQEHLSYLKTYIFHYLFDGSAQLGGGLADLELIALDSHFLLEGIMFEPLPVLHGRLRVLGYKFLNCAYISDVSEIPESTLKQLYGLDVLIIDALRYRPHSTHLSLDEALKLIAELKPAKTYLTHIAHDMRHSELEERLRDPDSGCFAPGVEPAYDGLTLEL
jgi:phosphoribosyl 1,2-cyclic phosphate phosphodiesterase